MKSRICNKCMIIQIKIISKSKINNKLQLFQSNKVQNYDQQNKITDTIKLLQKEGLKSFEQ